MKISNPVAKKGEEIAARYLQKKGYKILERNFRKNYGEIDIIAIDKTDKKESILVFIEVKSRTSSRFGEPVESINYFKLKSIIKTANYFILRRSNLPTAQRIDAISIYFEKSKIKELKHLENISSITDF